MRNCIVLFALFLLHIGCSKDKHELAPVSENITFGEFKDERDNNVYKTIQIGNQVWMAENLRFRLPAGGLDGCYTYGEESINWAQLAVDKQLFIDAVKLAIEKGEIVNPEGLPIAQQPIFIINMNINLMTPSNLMNRLVAYPAVVAVLNRINEQLKAPASVSLANSHFATAESQNGGYMTQYGLLYAHKNLNKVAPEGWRIPTDQDWKELETALGMNANELDVINSWRGKVGDRFIQGSEQSVGFDARLGGGRVYGAFLYGTPFINRGVSGYYWTSSTIQESDSTQLAIVRQLMINNKGVWRGSSKAEAAYHIRCIKNN